LTSSDDLDRDARFSASGGSLAFVRGRGDATAIFVLTLDAQMRATGDPRRVTTDSPNYRSPHWLQNDRELIFTAGPLGAGYIERVAVGGGRPRRVMTIDAPGGIAVSPRTNRLLISRSSDVDIYRVDLSLDGTQAESVVPIVVSPQYDGYPVYSPVGGRIAFASLRSGQWQIWACDKDGKNSIQLTSLKGGEAWPTSWTPPDGQQIGFVSNSDGTRRAYMVAAAGGIPERVPQLASVTSPIDFFWWSHDGFWIVYSTEGGVWKSPTTGGGTPIKVGSGVGLPTFDRAAITAGAPPVASLASWEIVPLDSGASRPSGFYSVNRPGSSDLLDSIARVHSAEGWYMVANSTPSSPGYLSFVRLLRAPLSNLSGADAAGFGMSLSPDGRSLLYTKFVSGGADLVLVENFK
jgi:hypothetical protein